jgi:hypothetical protein
MARPNKEGIDYFPLDVDIQNDSKVTIIESLYGNDGFSFIIKLLCKIYSNGYYLIWNEAECIAFKKYCGLEINVINNLINDCIKWGIFDNNLFNVYNILTSNGIQKRYFEAVNRRKIISIVNEFILIDLKDYQSKDKIINVNINSINVNINSINADIKKQSKVKYSKVKINNKNIINNISQNNENSNLVTTDVKATYNQDISKNGYDLKFDEARKAYIGTKRGLLIEFDNFKKRHKDYKEVIDLLKPAIELEIEHKTYLKEKGRFVPEWKNFATWIDQRCWEQEFPKNEFMEKEQTLEEKSKYMLEFIKTLNNDKK